MRFVSAFIILSIFGATTFAQGQKCPSPNFRCKRQYSGVQNCISQKLLCDGIDDCQDGSDEDALTCSRANRRACTFNEFRCENGECINNRVVCNGRADCTDSSDETRCNVNGVLPLAGNNDDTKKPSSTTPERRPTATSPKPQSTPKKPIAPTTPSRTTPRTIEQTCLSDEFQCASGHCIDINVICNGVRNCTDGSDEAPELCQVSGNNIDRSTPKPPGTSWQPIEMQPCFIPVEPENGEWKLESSQCADSSQDCDVPWNVRTLNPGTLLIYSCFPGYHLNGTSNVVCGPNGMWVNEPFCEEIRCPGLSSSTTEARCNLDGVAVSCENTVSIGTVATLLCRKGFVRETSFIPTFSEVECTSDGKWDPKPIKCVKKPRRVKLVLEGDMSMLDSVED